MSTRVSAAKNFGNPRRNSTESARCSMMSHSSTPSISHLIAKRKASEVSRWKHFVGKVRRDARGHEITADAIDPLAEQTLRRLAMMCISESEPHDGIQYFTSSGTARFEKPMDMIVVTDESGDLVSLRAVRRCFE